MTHIGLAVLGPSSVGPQSFGFPHGRISGPQNGNLEATQRQVHCHKTGDLREAELSFVIAINQTICRVACLPRVLSTYTIPNHAPPRKNIYCLSSLVAVANIAGPALTLLWQYWPFSQSCLATLPYPSTLLKYSSAMAASCCTPRVPNMYARPKII